MNQLHLPWLELSLLVPLIGAIWVARLRDRRVARQHSIVFSAIALAATVGATLDFAQLKTFEAHDRWDMVARLVGSDILVIDELNAPLIPLAALLYLLTAVATMPTQIRRFSFAWTLISESILLATLSFTSEKYGQTDPNSLVDLLKTSAGIEVRIRKMR